jgi:hypothetical protein
MQKHPVVARFVNFVYQQDYFFVFAHFRYVPAKQIKIIYVAARPLLYVFPFNGNGRTFQRSYYLAYKRRAKCF